LRRRERFLEKSWGALLQNISAYVPQEQEVEVDLRTIFENSSLYEHMKNRGSCEASRASAAPILRLAIFGLRSAAIYPQLHASDPSTHLGLATEIHLFSQDVLVNDLLAAAR
jgi:hypothetical protein